VRARVRAFVTGRLGFGAGGIDRVDRGLERHPQRRPGADARALPGALGSAEGGCRSDLLAFRQRDGGEPL
jgi:hypothetical protein